MVRIDNDKINEIRNSVNIVDVIGSYIKLYPKGRNYFAVCPFHNDKDPTSFSVNEEKQIYKCFRCGASGNVFDFVKEYDKKSFIEAVDTVAKSIGIDLNIGTFESKKALTKDNEIMNFALKYYQNNLNSKYGISAKEYLKNRAIDENTIKEFEIGLALDNNCDLATILQKKQFDQNDLIEIGLCNNSDKGMYDVYRKRIMFPIWDKDGNVVGFSGRIYNGEDEAKYVNSRASRIFIKSEILYNYHRAKNDVRIEKKVIVVEGFMDAIRLYVSGFKNVVATMGTALTDEQIKLLKQLRCQILLCQDNDDAGENAMISNGDKLLVNNVDFSIIKLHDYKDPDDFIKNKGIEEFKLLYDNPVSFVDFKIKTLKKKYNTDDSIELAKFMNEIIPTVNSINDDVLKSIIVGKLTKEYNIDSVLFTGKQIVKDDSKNKNNILPNEEKVKINKYQKASEELLYLMMNDSKYLKIFDKRIGYLNDPSYLKLLNEIRYFYETNKFINLADFMSYISDKKDIKDIVNSIIKNGIEEVNDEELENYLAIISKEIYHKRIQKLKNELENASNISEKREILKKIEILKKGSVDDGCRN